MEGRSVQQARGGGGGGGGGLVLVRLLLDVSGLEVEGDELYRVLLVLRLVLQTHSEHLQPPPHHLQLGVVQPAFHVRIVVVVVVSGSDG